MVEQGFGGPLPHIYFVSLNSSLSHNLSALYFSVNMILLGFKVAMSG